MSNIANQWLEQLDKDDTENNFSVLPFEKRKELAEILMAYGPEATAYVQGLDSAERDTKFIGWIMTMRSVEFKAEQATNCCQRVLNILDTHRYSKSTRQQLIEDVKELFQWLASI